MQTEQGLWARARARDEAKVARARDRVDKAEARATARAAAKPAGRVCQARALAMGPAAKAMASVMVRARGTGRVDRKPHQAGERGPAMAVAVFRLSSSVLVSGARPSKSYGTWVFPAQESVYNRGN